MTLIKCCGMFRPEDIAAVNAARPDFCGFVVDFPKSHRNVTVEQANALRGALDEGIAAAGVFVDQTPERIASVAATCAFDLVQLHGDENDADIRRLRELTDATIIKAFKVRASQDLEAAQTSSADYVLLDNGQGTGSAFDWELLAGFDRPFFLAGGLTPDNIPEAIARLRPYAIDISSGIETARVKDPEKIRAAIAAARQSSRVTAVPGTCVTLPETIRAKRADENPM